MAEIETIYVGPSGMTINTVPSSSAMAAGPSADCVNA